MIKTAAVLSTAHIPESEAIALSALIREVGYWEGAYEGPTGLLIPTHIKDDAACPVTTRSIIDFIEKASPGVEMVIFDKEAPTWDALPTVPWS